MTRQGFHREIEDLQQEILRMGSMVEDAIHRAITSLKTQDLDLAAAIIDGDDKIDAMEQDIEEKCLKLIALQQPLAKDLRTISTILKTVTDLERIGDQANNIAEITLRIGHEPLIKPLIDIPRMAEMSQRMVKESLDAFVNQDVDLARKVCRDDEPVDQLYSDLFDELMGFILEGGDVHRATQAINLLFVARYLERVADHATNIGERVIYMVTGERVAHQLKKGAMAAAGPAIPPAGGQMGDPVAGRADRQAGDQAGGSGGS